MKCQQSILILIVVYISQINCDYYKKESYHRKPAPLFIPCNGPQPHIKVHPGHYQKPRIHVDSSEKQEKIKVRCPGFVPRIYLRHSSNEHPIAYLRGSYIMDSSQSSDISYSEFDRRPIISTSSSISASSLQESDSSSSSGSY